MGPVGNCSILTPPRCERKKSSSHLIFWLPLCKYKKNKTALLSETFCSETVLPNNFLMWSLFEAKKCNFWPFWNFCSHFRPLYGPEFVGNFYLIVDLILKAAN